MSTQTMAYDFEMTTRHHYAPLVEDIEYPVQSHNQIRFRNLILGEVPREGLVVNKRLWRPSLFERLPAEIRYMIYEFLHYPITRITNPNRGLPAKTICYRDLNTVREKLTLLGVNRRIRTELLGLIFSKTTVSFGYHRGDEPVLWNTDDFCWHYECDMFRVSFYQMDWSSSFFESLVSVALSKSTDTRMPNYNWYQSEHVSMRTRLAEQAMAIRFIADHCPRLVFFTYYPIQTDHLRGKKRRITENGLRPRDVASVAIALRKLVLKCQDLDIVTFIVVENAHSNFRHSKYTRMDGPVYWHCQCDRKGILLDLRDVSVHKREDSVEQWVKEVIEILRLIG
ncbi:hypothetical protein B0J11DRAFT_507029 [Dendryphion nanum]|uniref:Uncharacterized protein n=1 Tax=Dendryphion nanum TaxID=256645 RepID=A0A9P9DS21_9PLEO|nr:hypothetical protein B0J11DRAFT_507029 [Dendryphion nanum]